MPTYELKVTAQSGGKQRVAIVRHANGSEDAAHRAMAAGWNVDSIRQVSDAWALPAGAVEIDAAPPSAPWFAPGVPATPPKRRSMALPVAVVALVVSLLGNGALFWLMRRDRDSLADDLSFLQDHFVELAELHVSTGERLEERIVMLEDTVGHSARVLVEHRQLLDAHRDLVPSVVKNIELASDRLDTHAELLSAQARDTESLLQLVEKQSGDIRHLFDVFDLLLEEVKRLYGLR